MSVKRIMVKHLRLLSIVALLIFSGVSQAAVEAYKFKTPKMEAEYNQLIGELRCLVCQNQNLSGSNADLAKDLRQKTHELLMDGNTPDQVSDYMVARYGDFVLYRPPLQNNTLLLWLGPFALLLLVIVLVFMKMRRKQVLVAPEQDAMAKAKQLLSEPQEK
ncbi:MAG: cytochrome c-type biogenesis protein CcmH [Urechidicola sp.]|jgi:cytochrome c-type biogenesis protein CcmH